MYDYRRTYQTARAVFSFLEFIGWSLVALGVIAALVGLGSGGLVGMAYRNPPGFVRLLAAIPGLGLALAGLISVAIVQVGRANVDSAEIAREMLALARRAQRATNDSDRNEFAKERSHPAPAARQSPPASSEIVKIYKGKAIAKSGSFYYVGMRDFSGVLAAENYIDKSEKLP